MERTLYRVFLASAALMCAALIVTPAWDWWHYRPLRTSRGAPASLAAIVSGPDDDVAGGEAAPLPAVDRHAPAAAPANPPVAAPPPAPGGSVPEPGRPAGTPHLALQATGVDPVAPRRVVRPRTVTATAAGAGALPGSPVTPPIVTPPAPRGGGLAEGASPGPSFVWGPAAPDTGHPGPVAPRTSPEPTPAPATPESTPPPAPDGTDGAGPRLTLVPDGTNLTAGQILHVTVALSGARDVSGVPFHLGFNAEVLEFQGARLGPVFSSTSLQPLLMASVSPSRPGDLVVGLALVKSSGLLERGGGILVLDFQAKQAGRSDLSFDRTSVRGAFSQDLPVELHGATIEVH